MCAAVNRSCPARPRKRQCRDGVGCSSQGREIHMAKQGEIEYLSKISAQARLDAFEKPFRDADCGSYLRDMGAIFDLLPPPPARLLDLGCGSGWTSILFARRG